MKLEAENVRANLESLKFSKEDQENMDLTEA